MRKYLIGIDKFIRRSLKMCVWNAWKTGKARYKGILKLVRLFKLNQKSDKQIQGIAYSGNRYCHMASSVLNGVIPNEE